MGAMNPCPGEFRYDILIEDADGRNLRIESARDLTAARERLPVLAKQYPGTRLLLRNRQTKVVMAQTEGY
ncbi:MAG TPA: hypothetical protein VN025_17220 [Candidatus Dormibacteraeota bacterium]|jgi:hypothetical protein|nr:hypothetical protein [Candidatus Dormibacteraeota bacterium]